MRSRRVKFVHLQLRTKNFVLPPNFWLVTTLLEASVFIVTMKFEHFKYSENKKNKNHTRKYAGISANYVTEELQAAFNLENKYIPFD